MWIETWFLPVSACSAVPSLSIPLRHAAQAQLVPAVTLEAVSPPQKLIS